LRVNGSAQIHNEGEMMKLFNAASRVVVVDINLVVPNCKAHIPIIKTIGS